MVIKKMLVSIVAFLFLTPFCAYALNNSMLEEQMYNTIKNKPYFSTQKTFVDKFVEKLDFIGFDSDKANWLSVDDELVVDNTSFKKIENVYYMVFKSKDNGKIGLVRFKCKTPEDGGFKKIETYNYKKFNTVLDIDVNRFNLIEETACQE